ncbi:MAG: hypothetical protein JXQ97_09345 [Natronospirillum sp.]
MNAPLHPFQPERVESSHRGISVHFPGDRVYASMDMAVLRQVHLVLWRNQLCWHLVSAGNELLIPCGIPGEVGMRRELQELPGFNTDLFFAYMDNRAGQEPPLLLWKY